MSKAKRNKEGFLIDPNVVVEPILATDTGKRLDALIRRLGGKPAPLGIASQNVSERAELAAIRAVFDDGDLDDTEGFDSPTTLECVQTLVQNYEDIVAELAVWPVRFLAERDRDPVVGRRRNRDYNSGYRMAMEDAARMMRIGVGPEGSARDGESDD